MGNEARTRHRIAAISRRLMALQEESVTPANAVRLLVAESILPTQANADSTRPYSSALASVIAQAGPSSKSLLPVVEHVGRCESSDEAMRALPLLTLSWVQRKGGPNSFAVIAIELALLLVVLLVHSIFVLPQMQAVFDAAGTPMPSFSRLVFALISPSSPVVWVLVAVFLILLAWRFVPAMLGPVLPLLDPALRQRNSDRICAWLGSAEQDEASQRSALTAAQAWHSRDALGRICARVLRETAPGTSVHTSLARARGIDPGLRASLALPNREDVRIALRARARLAGSIPEDSATLALPLFQVALGMVVAAVVIALYQPIFKLGSVL